MSTIDTLMKREVDNSVTNENLAAFCLHMVGTRYWYGCCAVATERQKAFLPVRQSSALHTTVQAEPAAIRRISLIKLS